MYLAVANLYDEGFEVSSPSPHMGVLVQLILSITHPPQAKSTAVQALERLSHLNRRTLDVISARIVYYYSLSHEHTGSLESVRRCVSRGCPRVGGKSISCLAVINSASFTRLVACHCVVKSVQMSG